MTKALSLIRFTSLETLLISAGKANLMLAIKHLAGLGFATLANLIDNILTVTKLFTNYGLPETPFTRKRKKTPNTTPLAQPDSTNTIPRRTNGNKFSKKQRHH